MGLKRMWQKLCLKMKVCVAFTYGFFFTIFTGSDTITPATIVAANKLEIKDFQLSATFLRGEESQHDLSQNGFEAISKADTFLHRWRACCFFPPFENFSPYGQCQSNSCFKGMFLKGRRQEFGAFSRCWARGLLWQLQRPISGLRWSVAKSSSRMLSGVRSVVERTITWKAKDIGIYG